MALVGALVGAPVVLTALPVSLMDSGSTLKPPKSLSLAAFFRVSTTWSTVTLWVKESSKSTITLPQLRIKNKVYNSSRKCLEENWF